MPFFFSSAAAFRFASGLSNSPLPKNAALTCFLKAAGSLISASVNVAAAEQADVGELVQVGHGGVLGLHTAHRESGHRAVRGSGKRAVGLLDHGNQIGEHHLGESRIAQHSSAAASAAAARRTRAAAPGAPAAPRAPAAAERRPEHRRRAAPAPRAPTAPRAAGGAAGRSLGSGTRPREANVLALSPGLTAFRLSMTMIIGFAFLSAIRLSMM